MDASELRIGNYVYSKQCTKPETVCTVTGYVANDVWYKYDYNDMWFGSPAVNEVPCSISKILPIHITHDWLINFGFAHDFQGVDIYTLDKIELYGYCAEWDWAFNWGDISNKEKHGQRAIEYVHELQNLYFALTGKELEVKQLVA